MITESLQMNCSIEKLFKISQDYSRRLEWDTFLQEAKILLPDEKPGVGVKTFCKAWNGIGIETVYVSFNEPKVVAVKMKKGPWIFREFAATWRFEEIQNGTLVTFIYHVKTKFRPLDFFFGMLFKLEMKRRLRDLKTYSEAKAEIEDEVIK